MPADVVNAAKATVPPVALVSLVMALAVAVPVALAPNAVALNAKLATTVLNAPTVEPVIKNFKRPDAPINPVTASVAAFRAAVLCVTDNLKSPYALTHVSPIIIRCMVALLTPKISAIC